MDRFYDKVMPEPNTGCWLWLSTTNWKGYGQFWINGKYQMAHRISYLWNVADIPDGLLVLHTCDNPSCVNPDHLRVGTNQDNMTDRNKKNRQAKGNFHGNRKLIDEDIISIRSMIDSKIPLRQIANAFGVTRRNINDIKNKAIWNHI